MRIIVQNDTAEVAAFYRSSGEFAVLGSLVVLLPGEQAEYDFTPATRFAFTATVMDERGTNANPR